MKRLKLLRLILCFFLVNISYCSFAQMFSGKVIRCDQEKAPIYKAICSAINGSDTLTVQTYFDGGFKLSLKPSSSYIISVGYIGYKDTVITVNTDRKGSPSVNNIVFCLKKDGMRLMGNLYSNDDDIPINNAGLILKNILTRQETRCTTGIDGYYNFKLDYESNYQLKIDKYSEGIMNIYQDTSFYISTIGFNLPLDFKLNVRLIKAREVVKPKPDKATLASSRDAQVKKTGSTTNIAAKSDTLLISNPSPVSATTKAKEEHTKERPKEENKPNEKKQLETKLLVEKTEKELDKDSKTSKENVSKKVEKKRHSVSSQLSMEDSLKIKEKIIIEAQKELERQNQLALERQKREAYESSQRDMMKYYESKVEGKNEDIIATNKTIDKAVVETKTIVAQKQEPTVQKYYNYSVKPKKTIIKGNVLDGANQLKMVGVNVSVRPLNSIFSVETQTDKMGYFEAEVDSGGMYIISFFKSDYKISKQFIDLSDKSTKEYTLQDVYLGENVNVDINRDMPAFFFFKNKAELTESVVEELNAIIVLMAKDPSYSIKLIGLAAADENFPKPLSTSRVQSIAQYLVANGVNSTQIKFVALGDTKHRSNCGLSKPCTSEDYDKDRAVVYLITK